MTGLALPVAERRVAAVARGALRRVRGDRLAAVVGRGRELHLLGRAGRHRDVHSGRRLGRHRTDGRDRHARDRDDAHDERPSGDHRYPLPR